LQIQPLFHGFMFLHRLLARMPREVFLHEGFRSSSSIWDQDGWERRHEVQTSMGGAAWPRAHTTSAHLGLIAPLVCFFFSCCFSGKIAMPEKY
jgi:hypothetical protein